LSICCIGFESVWNFAKINKKWLKIIQFGLSVMGRVIKLIKDPSFIHLSSRLPSHDVINFPDASEQFASHHSRLSFTQTPTHNVPASLVSHFSQQERRERNQGKYGNEASPGRD